MNPVPDTPLWELSTRWSLIVRAHSGGPEAREALAELLPRYCTAVYGYLRAAVRDEGTVEEVCQEFAYRFVRGDFRHARPENGRFRDYVRASVRHLVGEYRKRAERGEKLVTFDSRVLAAAPAADPDAEFRERWRKELLNRTWSVLRYEGGGDPPTPYDVLRRKADEPALRSADLAADLAARFGRPVSAANARQMLRRARARFAALLRIEVAASIPTTDPAEVDAELAELGLLTYCPPPGTDAG